MAKVGRFVLPGFVVTVIWIVLVILVIILRQAAKRIPRCQYVELPGLGHGAPLLAADKVNPILAEFLD